MKEVYGDNVILGDDAMRISRVMKLEEVDLWVFGKVRISPIIGKFVIRARRLDRTVIYINVCSCDDVPFHDSSHPSTQTVAAIDGTDSNVFVMYMVCGDANKAVNDADVYDVAIHSKVFDDIDHGSGSAEEKEALRQQLCEQVLACLKMSKAETSFFTYSVDNSVGNYLQAKHIQQKRNSMLQMLEEAKESESNEYVMISAINQSLNLMDSYDGHLAIPSKKAFKEWQYLHTSITIASNAPSTLPTLTKEEGKQLQKLLYLRRQHIQSLLRTGNVDNFQRIPQSESAPTNSSMYAMSLASSSMSIKMSGIMSVSNLDMSPHPHRIPEWKTVWLTPNAGYVIKTKAMSLQIPLPPSASPATSMKKRLDTKPDENPSDKVFINVFHHIHMNAVQLNHVQNPADLIIGFGKMNQVEDKEGHHVPLISILVASSFFKIDKIESTKAGPDSDIVLAITNDAFIKEIITKCNLYYPEICLDCQHFSLPKVKNGYKGVIPNEGLDFRYQDSFTGQALHQPTPSSPPQTLPNSTPSKNERRGSTMAQWASDLLHLPLQLGSSTPPPEGNRARLSSQDSTISADDNIPNIPQASPQVNRKLSISSRKTNRKSILDVLASHDNHEGEKLLTAEMMEYDPKKNVSVNEAQQAKQQSAETPEFLLGWQINLFQHNGDIGKIFINLFLHVQYLILLFI